MTEVFSFHKLKDFEFLTKTLQIWTNDAKALKAAATNKIKNYEEWKTKNTLESVNSYPKFLIYQAVKLKVVKKYQFSATN